MTLPPVMPGKRRTLNQIGLDMREVMLIQSLFSSTPELQKHFQFDSQGNDSIADIVLVNGDSNDSLETWEAMHKQAPATEALFITNSDRDFAPYRALRRPLNLRNISAVLSALEGDTEEQATPAKTSTKASGSRALEVLIVDDSRQAREFLTMKVNELAPAEFGVNIDSADNAEDGLARCQNKTYDLVFLDVEMPGMNGFEACKKIRAISQARIAMLTSKSMAEDFREGSKSGCNHYLVKPPHDGDVRVILSLTSMKKY